MYGDKFQSIQESLLLQGELVILVTDRPPSPTHICRFLQIFCHFCPYLKVSLHLNAIGSISLQLLINPLLLLKMLKLFFQVPNAGGMKAAGSLHASPNSINRV